MMIHTLLAALLFQAPLVLSITYSDGRTSRRIITATATNGWTPMFPKSAQWRSPEGLAVTGINYRHVLEDGGVRVAISVFLGSPLQKELDVARVLVTPETPVRVTALEQFGVEAVALSLSAFDPRALPPPRVENKTAALHIESVEMSAGDRPGYRIGVRNDSKQPVLSFFVDSFRDGRPALSGRRGERDGTPVVLPGDTYTFFLGTEHPLDLLRVTGLMFEDGTVEGDVGGVASTRVVFAGRRLQLEKVVAIFQEALRAPSIEPMPILAPLSARIEALPVLPGAEARQFAAGLLPPNGPAGSTEMIDGALAAGMLEVRKGVLGDLQEAPRDREAFAGWLREITAQYTRWYLRFIELTAR
jgi:hypothetical protein